jgi:tRNA(fMet)-specific endonuclease VapC
MLALWKGSQITMDDLQAKGKAVAYADGEIAAVSAVNKLTLVTRNTEDFESFENLMLENWFD